MSYEMKIFCIYLMHLFKCILAYFLLFFFCLNKRRWLRSIATICDCFGAGGKNRGNSVHPLQALIMIVCNRQKMHSLPKRCCNIFQIVMQSFEIEWKDTSYRRCIIFILFFVLTMHKLFFILNMQGWWHYVWCNSDMHIFFDVNNNAC